jgi:hypothetical protein
MMFSADATRLMRVLSGQRFRVGDSHWVVLQSLVEHNHLQLELSGAHMVSIDFDLPDTFDCRSGEHMAWLLGQIEEQLKARRT